MTLNAHTRHCFLEQYRQVRHAEGRGSHDAAYYRALPYEDLTGQNSSMWAMRARSYRYLETKLLPKWEQVVSRPLDILDLGAGNCWMSYRLGLRNHHVTALDIFDDPLDGLGAARWYPFSIPTIEAEFNTLPFAPDTFDLIIYNAAIHYSTDYFETLGEAQRCLRPSGRVVIIDSPVYRSREHGVRMVAERKLTYRKKYGFASDAMNSIEFLDEPVLQLLSKSLGLQWRVHRPWYGWHWHLRPFKAFLQRRRPPSKFWILVGSFSRP
ncbi:MAG: class I SAM-dependent methyltransferase [Bryobacteraceae bacterium]